MKNRRIRFKLIATFFFISFFSVFVIGAVFFFKNRAAVLSEIETSLRIVANAKAQQVEDFFYQHEIRALDFASDGFISNSIEHLRFGFDEEISVQLLEHLKKNKMPLDPSLFLIEIFDTQGMLLTTTGTDTTASLHVPLEKLESITPYSTLISTFITHYTSEGSVLASVVITPIFSRVTGERVGYLANYSTLDSLVQILSGDQKTWSDRVLGWNSLETILINSEGLVMLMSPSHTPVSMNESIDLRVFNEACKGKPVLHRYNNHHKDRVQVAGLLMCVDQELYLIIEVQTQEIFTYFFKTFRTVIGLAIGLVLCMTVLALFPIYKIISPLEQLTQMMKRFGEGKKIDRFNYSSTDEIGELFLSFDKMKETLQTTEQRMFDFISIISHQLRNFLTSIRLYIELLRNVLTHPTIPQKDFVDSIEMSVDQMVNLINDLLNLSSIEAGKFPFQMVKIDMNEVMKKVMKEISPLVQQERCTVHFISEKKSVPILVDRDFITQVFRNLIINAIKYSRNRVCEIFIFVDEVKEGPHSFLRVRIKDSGIGIKPEDQAHIFEKFFRSEMARKQNPEGTGLGLYVAKVILDQMGGKISFKSEEGIGTVFTVLLPKEERNLSRRKARS